MNPAKVIVHEVQCYGVFQVLDLLAETVGQAGKATHPHPHGEILALHVARGDLGHVGGPHNTALVGTDKLRGTVAFLGLFGFPRIAVVLHQHGVVDIIAKGTLYGLNIRLVAVRGELHAMRQPGGQIFDKDLGALFISFAHHERRHQLGVRADSGPGIHVAMPEHPFVLRSDVLLLAVAERPDFIALDAFAGQIPKGLVLVLAARRPHVHQQLGHGIDAHACQPGRGAHAIAFHEQGEDLGAVLEAQAIHSEHYA